MYSDVRSWQCKTSQLWRADYAGGQSFPTCPVKILNFCLPQKSGCKTNCSRPFVAVSQTIWTGQLQLFAFVPLVTAFIRTDAGAGRIWAQAYHICTGVPKPEHDAIPWWFQHPPRDPAKLWQSDTAGMKHHSQACSGPRSKGDNINTPSNNNVSNHSRQLC